ncbi:hypothetical protein A3K92_08755 [Thermococcus gorgonarius]|uniref:DUF5615 domain-containing protein n=1 Tax=Thermococcus gorgonarius TaxID=71997 RepID=A0A2Z2MAI3_THEGO|nr:hypothetical protein A3K92_08755 [Thermococcus gorgonarius]
MADENVPYGVVKRLANNEGRILITFDRDFGTILFVEGLKLPGLILLRFPPKNVEYIYKNLKALLSKDIDFQGKIVSVHEDRIRIGKM